ncbi:Ig-like domain-containing protein [Deinococcus sonorensis]|uniref:Ig-like domain-containing protein n=1 Tax=Deinococcus sonorensis TaxID=309891 RepID=A0ABV8Y485_9DEIO
MNRHPIWNLSLLSLGLLASCTATPGPHETKSPGVRLVATPSTLTAPGPLALEATVDGETRVTQVDFYKNGQLYTADTAAPFTASEDFPATTPGGTFTYTATARDTAGQATTSAAVRVTVRPANTVPGEKGWITGHVRNSEGRPIPDVDVWADNQLLYDSNLSAVTDVNGAYRINIKAIPTTWRVTANANFSYKGQSIHVPLVPTNPADVAGPEGGVRDFVMRPQDITDSDPYGNLGIVSVTQPVGEYDIDESKVRLTLEPVGLLADGTTGTARTVKPIRSGSGWIVPNVMYGTYRVTATQDGRPLEIRKRASGAETPPWGPSYTGDFIYGWNSTRLILYVEVRD